MVVKSFKVLPDYQQNFNRFFALMLFSAKLRKANPLLKNISKSMNVSDSDVQNLLKSFVNHEVKYLLIGGMADAFYGHTRTTQDMDIWIKNSPENRNALKATAQPKDIGDLIELEKIQRELFG